MASKYTNGSTSYLTDISGEIDEDGVIHIEVAKSTSDFYLYRIILVPTLSIGLKVRTPVAGGGETTTCPPRS